MSGLRWAELWDAWVGRDLAVRLWTARDELGDWTKARAVLREFCDTDIWRDAVRRIPGARGDEAEFQALLDGLIAGVVQSWPPDGVDPRRAPPWIPGTAYDWLSHGPLPKPEPEGGRS